MSRSYAPEMNATMAPSRRLHVLLRSSIIGVTAFLTVVGPSPPRQFCRALPSIML